MATKAVPPKAAVKLPPLVDKAKADYEAELASVNSLRSAMMDQLSKFQSQTYKMLRSRAKYVRLAKKAGLEVPPLTWWEKGVGQ